MNESEEKEQEKKMSSWWNTPMMALKTRNRLVNRADITAGQQLGQGKGAESLEEPSE